jgi:hypothetical protein
MTEAALAKLTKAEQWLAEAKSLDELKEIHDIALAAEAYAKAHRLGVLAENHAIEVRLLAGRRIGELVPPEPRGGPRGTPKSEVRTMLPVTKQRLSEFRKLAAVPIVKFKAKIAEAKSRNEKISYSRFLDGARSGTWGPVLDSKDIEWWTPTVYIEAVHETMGGIDLDPASCPKANETVRASAFYTAKDDGAAQPWQGRVFLNPPYGKAGAALIEKFLSEALSSFPEGILLVNSRATDADWFQPCFNGVVCFTDHRIDFDSPEEKPTSSTHGSCFIYFGPNEKRFADVFSRFGNIVKRWPESDA